MGKTVRHSDRLSPRSRLGVLILFAVLASLLLNRCTGAGIFSTIAISTKIDDGKLPSEISAGAVFHVSGASGYLFFVSGPNIWAKSTGGDEWFPIGLNAGGMEWDGVQSAVATESRIILALYYVSGKTYKVGIFALESFDGSSATYRDLNKSWTSGSRSFQTIRLFCPRPDGGIYINVLHHQGIYGSLDSDNNDFGGSELYRLANGSTSWGTPAYTEQPDLNGTNKARYVTGVADNGRGTILVTATSGVSSTDGGYLLNEDGLGRGNGSIGGLYMSTTGITWIDREWPGHSSPNHGAFILASTSLVGGVHRIFASSDGSTWQRLGGASSYRITNFIDVSDKTSGMSNSKHLVLAGTSGFIDGNIYRRGVGYNEIDVTDDNLTRWVVNTNRNSYSFANLVNYNVGTLSESTVTAMSIPEIPGDGNSLYASTRNNGIWKVNLSADRPSWTRE